MTASDFTIDIHDIRNAIKHANRDVLTNKPVNTVELHEKIRSLTNAVKQQASGIDPATRDILASDLTVLAQELDSLENLIEQHIDRESN